MGTVLLLSFLKWKTQTRPVWGLVLGQSPTTNPSVYPLCDDPVRLPPSVPSAAVREADGQQRHSSDNMSEGFHVGVQEKSVMGGEGGCVALCVFSKGRFGFNV